MAKLNIGADMGDAGYIDTPRGIFTVAGTWFHTTEDELRTFAGPVLEKEPLEVFIKRSEVWLRSPQTVSLWAMLVLLFLPSALWAAIAVPIVYVAWYLIAPSLGNQAMGRLLTYMEKTGLQVVAYILVLGWFANWPDFAKVALGLIWFILIRWRVIDWVVKSLLRPVWHRFYPLGPADQTLRGVIVSAALHHRMDLPEVKRMEQRMIQALQSKKKK